MCTSNSTKQITDINTRQFIHKLINLMQIISMQSNGAVITLYGSGSGSGGIRRRISSHIRFRPVSRNWNPLHPY